MKKKDILILRIEEQAKKKLKKVALENGRSMSNYVMMLIRDAIKSDKKI